MPARGNPKVFHPLLVNGQGVTQQRQVSILSACPSLRIVTRQSTASPGALPRKTRRQPLHGLRKSMTRVPVRMPLSGPANPCSGVMPAAPGNGLPPADYRRRPRNKLSIPRKAADNSIPGQPLFIPGNLRGRLVLSWWRVAQSGDPHLPGPLGDNPLSLSVNC